MYSTGTYPQLQFQLRLHRGGNKMLCIFKAVPTTETHRQKQAHQVQAEIEAALPTLEHDPKIRHTIEGVNRITQESAYYNSSGALLSADDKAYVDKQDAEFKSIMGITDGTLDTADTLDLSASGSNRKTYISTSIEGITIESFITGSSFGNGVTCNVAQKLKDGTKERFSWCVFPQGTTLTDAQLEQLRVIFETAVAM